ncbi:phytanoyl-CoA dioxygenase family protein [Chloroflexi bacterium TSY]|nr:phytanoyl-CoA dioxygenase family protein [Chloroflexi bacterium TSY]
MNHPEFYQKNGYLHIPQLFTSEETNALSDEMDRLVEEWALTTPGWSGPWRQVYMDPETEKNAKLTAMHDLHLYSMVWMRAVTNPKLAQSMSQLIGPDVELHHSTMHIKPPQSGQPFPMHQDHPFYAHEDERFVDVLVHLDETSHENGEIRFLAGSHKNGPLKHITETEEGRCSPHLPTDQWRLEDTVPVPAKRGDVVCFCYHTIHGSYINQTRQPRRLVRIGYRNPHNKQQYGQSLGRPGLIVYGFREREEGQELLKNT